MRMHVFARAELYGNVVFWVAMRAPLLSAALKQNSCLGCFASSCFQIVLPLSYYMFTTTALSRPARC